MPLGHPPFLIYSNQEERLAVAYPISYGSFECLYLSIDSKSVFPPLKWLKKDTVSQLSIFLIYIFLVYHTIIYEMSI
jgi:hypothetical protein